MRVIQAAIAHLVESFGFDVKRDSNGDLELYWSLYTQGSGVAFKASVPGTANFIRELALEGSLAEAMACVEMVEEHDLSFSIVRNDSRYTHAQTMDVEIDGPHVDVDEETTEFISAVERRIKEAAEDASHAAENILHALFLLPISEMEVVKSYTTTHWKVELIKQPFHDATDEINHIVDYGDDAEEHLAAIRELVDPRRMIELFDLRARVLRREEEDDDDWEEIADEYLGCYTHVVGEGDRELLRELRCLARQTIEEVRKQNEPCHKLKQSEAA